MTDTVKAKPRTTQGGEPEPETGQPVARHHPNRAHGERQDGPGAGPHREEASEATPVGTRAASRTGSRQGVGGDDPFAAHRGDPAGLHGGAATGSGAGPAAVVQVRARSPIPTARPAAAARDRA